MSFKKIDVKATLASRENLGEGIPFLTIPAGKRVWLRILPPREDHPNDTFFLAMPLHYGVGRNEAIVPCLLRLKQAYCPVCEYNQRMSKLGKEPDRVTTRCLMNVVVLDEDGNPKEEKVNVWTAPQRVVLDLLDEMSELPEKSQDITDLKRGRDIWIKRRGTTRKNTTWKAGILDEASTFPMPELAEQAFDLTKVFPERSAEAILSLLTGGNGRDGDDPWEELDESPKHKELPRGRRHVVEDDEEEEEEPEKGEYREVEEEEPEEKPRARRRSRPDPEEPGDEPEEEDEEEKPKPRARRVVKSPKEEEPEEPEEGEEEEPSSPRGRLERHLKNLK